MLPKLRAGRVLDDQTFATLSRIRTDLGNVYTGAARDAALFTSYHGWVESAVNQLAMVVTDEELTRLVRTESYFWFTTSASRGGEAWRGLRLEIGRLTEVWNQLIVDCTEYRRHWRGPACILVPDTNVWIQHPKPFYDVDWRVLAHTGPDFAVRVVVLMPVLGELDDLKRPLRSDKSKVDEKNRLRETIRGLSERFSSRDTRKVLVPKSSEAFSETTVELVLEDFDNTRLSITDHEIVKQSQILASRTGLRIKIVTGDLLMRVAAIGLGIEVEFLDYESLRTDVGGET